MTTNCILCNQPIPKKTILNGDVKIIARIISERKLSIPEFAKLSGISKRTLYRWFSKSHDENFRIKDIYIESLAHRGFL